VKDDLAYDTLENVDAKNSPITSVKSASKSSTKTSPKSSLKNFPLSSSRGEKSDLLSVHRVNFEIRKESNDDLRSDLDKSEIDKINQMRARGRSKSAFVSGSAGKTFKEEVFLNLLTKFL
jgi:hypothetical protein